MTNTNYFESKEEFLLTPKVDPPCEDSNLIRTSMDHSTSVLKRSMCSLKESEGPVSIFSMNEPPQIMNFFRFHENNTIPKKDNESTFQTPRYPKRSYISRSNNRFCPRHKYSKINNSRSKNQLPLMPLLNLSSEEPRQGSESQSQQSNTSRQCGLQETSFITNKSLDQIFKPIDEERDSNDVISLNREIEKFYLKPRFHDSKQGISSPVEIVLSSVSSNAIARYELPFLPELL